MLLVDLSQIAIANIMASPDIAKNQLDESLIKHMILTSIKSLKEKFFNTYGDVIICCDSRHSWRKDMFPHYKASRKKDKDDSYIDWTLIYNTINSFKKDLKENFPYKVVEVYGAEADDIIGVLSKLNEKTLIVSSDKDYAQLVSDTVKQYCPKKKALLNIDNPAETLRELIIRGDKSDGIPNIRSVDDSFVSGVRQLPITKAFLEEAMIKIPEESENYFIRNDFLINLSHTPKDLVDKIIEEYNVAPVGNRQTMHNYFVNNKMKIMLSEIGKF